MHSLREDDNPFAVQTPEDMPAADTVSLFVDVFSDFYSIPSVGHTFLHGARGSGKSMMFRFLEPDCQMLAMSRRLSDLPFYSVYVPIKNTNLTLTELRRLDDAHAAILLNEHFLVAYVAVRVFSSLQNRAGLRELGPEAARDLGAFYTGPFAQLLENSGWTGTLPYVEGASDPSAYISNFVRVLNGIYASVISYLKRLAFRTRPLPYKGPLCGFLDFLVPMLKDLRELGFMPQAPIYLLLDDADNLSQIQTKILNSWVSCRTSALVSLKISTQLTYKTYRTLSGAAIETPHDYSEVNVSAIYTSPRTEHRYYERVSAIVKKRLALKHNIETTPEDYFPPDQAQEDKIDALADKMRERWPDEGRGYRARDDAYRYARPDFIKSLAGSRKAGSTYSYAGFPQLVHLSSGIVRYFLEAAARMYSETKATYPERDVVLIPPHIQDKVVREQADNFLTKEFDKLVADVEEASASLDRTRRLRNLIHALGGTFHEILMSDAAERRVFSIALSDEPDAEVQDVLRLGVQYGYFQDALIGNKEGTGRTRLYILTKRLAPAFDLDPTGFAGYKFVISDVLRRAMIRPKTFVGRVRSLGVEYAFGDNQLGLFTDGET